ncbi:MAG: sulfatase [Kofleriaceae bacterium]
MSFASRFTLLAIATLVACQSPASAPLDAQPDTPPGDAASIRKPNVVFVVVDDLDTGVYDQMPRLKTLLDDAGARFDNHYLNIALCCPSRAAILRGQYAHNTKIFGNGPPHGGFEAFFTNGSEAETLPVWLAAAGYRTTLIGKYMNGYPTREQPLYIPPGWTEWRSPVDGGPYGEYDYTLNENGVSVPYGNTDQDYLVDVIAAKSADFIQRAATERTPFFMYITPYAPHSPATPATRYQDAFPGAKAPRTASFNEDAFGDKPAWLRDNPKLDAMQIDQMDRLYRKRLQSMLAVEDLVQQLIDTLTATGELEHTYIVFTSDNGFHQGQHRMISGKQTAFEEDINVPLIVRGPGIAAGSRIAQASANVDFAPTFLDLAGTPIPAGVDGRSLRALLAGTPPATWRQAILLEHGEGVDPETERFRSPPGTLEPADSPLAGESPPPFEGIRTTRYTYVEYPSGERELYDNETDPAQLENIAADASNQLLGQLSSALRGLHDCSGEACRVAEQVTVP